MLYTEAEYYLKISTLQARQTSNYSISIFSELKQKIPNFSVEDLI